MTKCRYNFVVLHAADWRSVSLVRLILVTTDSCYSFVPQSRDSKLVFTEMFFKNKLLSLKNLIGTNDCVII